MSDTAPPDWPQREPYKTLIDAAEVLEAKGFSVPDVIEAFYVLGTAMDVNRHGPRVVAIRSRAIADRYAEEAARDVS